MSCYSSHNLLSSFGEHLESPLISETAGRALRALSAKLPALGSAQYLELRLGADAPARLDFLIAISRLQRDWVKHHSEQYLALGPGLSPLCRSLERWTDRDSSLYEALPLLWLEFDDVERQCALSANLCATVAPSYLDPFSPVVSLARADLPSILFEVLSMARGSAASCSERDALTRCVRALPAGAHWLHLSVMTARSPEVVKLYGVFPAGTVVEYLRKIGWAGDVSQIERLLTRAAAVGGATAEVYVDLCVTELLGGDRHSFGLCFSKQLIDPKDPRRSALIESLLADRLCTEAQARALSDWTRNIGVGLGSESRLFLERWFEIKLVYQSPEPLLAKAYLGFALGSASPGYVAPSQTVRHQSRV